MNHKYIIDLSIIDIHILDIRDLISNVIIKHGNPFKYDKQLMFINIIINIFNY